MTVAMFSMWEGGEVECRIISRAKIVRPLFSDDGLIGLNVDGVDITCNNFNSFEIKEDQKIDLDKYKEDEMIN